MPGPDLDAVVVGAGIVGLAAARELLARRPGLRLAVLEREDAPGRATRAGARLSAALADLPGVASVRGEGLLLAAELAPGIDAKRVGADLLARGLIVNAVTPTALRFAPPLLVSDDEIDEAVGLLADVLAEAPDGEEAAS